MREPTGMARCMAVEFLCKFLCKPHTPFSAQKRPDCTETLYANHLI
jgi:hypothetical protein